METFQAMIPNVAGLLGVEPSTALLLVLLISAAGNLIGRWIPDDRTGLLGLIRDAGKVVGLYAANRVSPGVTIADVAKQLAEKKDNSDER